MDLTNHFVVVLFSHFGYYFINAFLL